MKTFVEEVREYFSYDQETGVFIKKNTGKIVGGANVGGYIVVSFKKKKYYAHRIAWLIVYGEFPPGMIDHRNRDKADNRLVNLRLATKAQNSVNSASVNALSGVRGVYYQSNSAKWRVKCGNVNVGYFNTREEADLAYRRKAIELYGDFAIVDDKSIAVAAGLGKK